MDRRAGRRVGGLAGRKAGRQSRTRGTHHLQWRSNGPQGDAGRAHRPGAVNEAGPQGDAAIGEGGRQVPLSVTLALEVSLEQEILQVPASCRSAGWVPGEEGSSAKTRRVMRAAVRMVAPLWKPFSNQLSNQPQCGSLKTQLWHAMREGSKKSEPPGQLQPGGV
jgi:hypothetical protein